MQMSFMDHRRIVLLGIAVGAVGVAAIGFLLSKRSGNGGSAQSGATAQHPHPQPHSHSHSHGDAHSHTHGKRDESEGEKTNGIRPVSSLVKRGYTKEELSKFNGANDTHVFVSLKRKVYEVAPQFYGPGAPYHIFAGKEASRCLAKSVLDDTQANKYWVDCSEEELQSLEEYVDTFESKYPVVGWFIPDKSFYDI